MADILFDGALHQRIAVEIEPSFLPDGSLKLIYLLESCTLLNSVYEETLRIVNYPVGARTVMKSMHLHGQHLRPGRKLLMMYRQMHFNPDIFDPNATQFGLERFLRNPTFVEKPQF